MLLTLSKIPTLIKLTQILRMSGKEKKAGNTEHLFEKSVSEGWKGRDSHSKNIYHVPTIPEETKEKPDSSGGRTPCSTGFPH